MAGWSGAIYNSGTDVLMVTDGSSLMLDKMYVRGFLWAGNTVPVGPEEATVYEVMPDDSTEVLFKWGTSQSGANLQLMFDDLKFVWGLLFNVIPSGKMFVYLR
jgi:hypothetical protein